MAIKIQEKSIDRNSLIGEFEKEYGRFGIHLSDEPLGSIGYTITFSGSLFQNLTEKELSLLIPRFKDVLSDLKKINKSKDLTESSNRILYKEISKKDKNLYTIWDEDKIKKTFNFGHGTMKDFKNYMDNNRKFADFENLMEKTNSPDEDLTKILKKLPAKVQAVVMDLIAEIGDHPKFKDEAYFQDLAYNKMSDRGFSKKDISLATDSLVKYYR
jgi:hydroxymethylpyrimidine pyrophosphatase-like HAD family hydrolase